MDFVTHLPSDGRCVTRDVMVTDMIAQSYLPVTSQTLGAAADRKTAPLTQAYSFIAIA